MKFATPWVLYLLWLAPLFGLLWHRSVRQSQARLASFVSPRMLAHLAPARGLRRPLAQAWLAATGLLLCLAAAARPQWGEIEQKVFARGRDLMICLDVSRSMLANDLHPSRLGRAKADLLDLLRELDGDRAGLIVFRRRAALVCPLTSDYGFLRQALDAAGPDSAPRGETDIGDAVQKALESFDSESASHKAILLVSDGEDLTGRVLEIAAEAARREIPVFTVGLGSSAGSRIPDDQSAGGFVRHQDQPVTTRLDNETLDRIARATGGAYVPLELASTARTTLGTIYRDHLRAIGARDYEESTRRRRAERFQYFLLPGVLFLLAAACMSPGRLSTALRTAALFALLAVPWPAAAQTNAVPLPIGRTGALRAQELFSAGKYAEAAEAYRAAAQAGTAAEIQSYRFNEAVALHRAGRHDEAANLFAQLSSGSGRLASDALVGIAATRYAESAAAQPTNAAAAAIKADSAEAAAEALRAALRATPADESHARNLTSIATALPRLKEDAKIAALVEQHGNADAGALAAQMLAEQDRLARDAAATMTNRTPEQIRLLEELAVRQRANADLWVPLKGKLLQASQQAGDTNLAAGVAQLAGMAEATRSEMNQTADELESLATDAPARAQGAGQSVYQIWRALAPFPLVLAEDIRRQSNALAAAAQDVRTDQAIALELTHLFTNRFIAAVPPQGLPAQAGPGAPDAPTTPSTNMLISPETRIQILALAADTIRAQQDALRQIEMPPADASVPQQAALDALHEIEKLLPRQQQQPQPQPPPSPQPEPRESETQPQEQPHEKQDAKKPDEPPRDVQEMMRQALQREKDYQERLRERNRQVPLTPGDRDW